MPSSYNVGSRYEALIKDLVESGRYASASEVVRDGLRLIEEREEHRQVKLTALRQAIQDGIDSGPAGPLNMDHIIAAAKAAKRAPQN